MSGIKKKGKYQSMVVMIYWHPVCGKLTNERERERGKKELILVKPYNTVNVYSLFSKLHTEVTH